MTLLMKCNYDDWATKVPAKINDKMQRVLSLMSDGMIRSRTDMLKAAGIDPNPRKLGGTGGMEATDYFLYKKGLIKIVMIDTKNQKYFQIA